MTDADIKRIESELREIKAMLMILIPTYGETEKKAASIFGWTEKKENDTVSHAKRRGNNSQADRPGQT